MPQHDLFLPLRHPPIQLLEVFQQSGKQLPRVAWQAVLAILQDLWHTLRHMTNALRDNDPELRQQPADLIRLRSALFHQSLAHPMQREHRLLLQ
jgi:hypothetical protein